VAQDDICLHRYSYLTWVEVLSESRSSNDLVRSSTNTTVHAPGMKAPARSGRSTHCGARGDMRFAVHLNSLGIKLGPEIAPVVAQDPTRYNAVREPLDFNASLGRDRPFFCAPLPNGWRRNTKRRCKRSLCSEILDRGEDADVPRCGCVCHGYMLGAA